jgi:predicted nucleic acid-binding protein
MAALKYLIDTSVVTRLHLRAVQEVLLPKLETIARVEITDLEVGSRARNGKEWDAYLGALVDFKKLPVPAEVFNAAMAVQRVLAEKGLRGRKIPDLLIAASAAHYRLTVLHYDHDFDHIHTITRQPVQWILPAGTID